MDCQVDSVVTKKTTTHYTGTIYGNSSDSLSKGVWKTYTYSGAPVCNPSGIYSGLAKGGTIIIEMQGSTDTDGTNWITLAVVSWWGDSTWGSQRNNESWSCYSSYADTPIYQIRYRYTGDGDWARWCQVNGWDIITKTKLKKRKTQTEV